VAHWRVDSDDKVWNQYMIKILTASLLPLVLLAGCERYSTLPQCSSVLDMGTPVAMVLDTKGSALDTQEGLRWYRCSAGQRFSNDQCVDQALELPRQGALDYAAEFAARAGQPWRVPTVAEMKTLKQKDCQNPAIDTRVFPSILVSNYWTSTASRAGSSMGCTVYTFNGNSICKELATQKHPFLLVMDAEP
jgi:hypothetical protein